MQSPEGSLFNTRDEAVEAARAYNKHTGHEPGGSPLFYYETRDHVQWRKWTVVYGTRKQPGTEVQRLNEGEFVHKQWHMIATSQSGNRLWDGYYDDTAEQREEASKAAERAIAKGWYVYADLITRYKFGAPDKDISGFNMRVKHER